MDNRLVKFCLKILSRFRKIIRKPHGGKIFWRTLYYTVIAKIGSEMLAFNAVHSAIFMAWDFHGEVDHSVLLVLARERENSLRYKLCVVTLGTLCDLHIYLLM